MGTWGHGIFENDNAADILVALYDSLEKEAASYLDSKSDSDLEPDDMADHVLAHLGLIRIIAEGVVRTEERTFDHILCAYRVPQTEKLREWKKRMIRIHISYWERAPVDPNLDEKPDRRRHRSRSRFARKEPYDPNKDLRLAEIVRLFDRLIELSKTTAPPVEPP